MNQDCKDFIWLVIDDGSTDNTEAEVKEFIKESNIQIQYKKKDNGGKHTALNFSYQFIDTELTFIVDSDDELTKDAISTIISIDKKFNNEKDLCGYSFLRQKREGGYLNSGTLPENGYKADYVTCRINGNLSGDMAEVWKTKCLKEFPFPEFKGEKFLGEDIVWLRMAKKYKMRFFNKAIYISNYLEDGLTNNRRKHNIESPNGCIARSEEFLDSKAHLKYKIKAVLQYSIYGKFAGLSFNEMLKRSNNKFSFITLYPASTIVYFNWKATNKE